MLFCHDNLTTGKETMDPATVAETSEIMSQNKSFLF
jgi:hypothetical protein